MNSRYGKDRAIKISQMLKNMVMDTSSGKIWKEERKRWASWSKKLTASKPEGAQPGTGQICSFPSKKKTAGDFHAAHWFNEPLDSILTGLRQGLRDSCFNHECCSIFWLFVLCLASQASITHLSPCHSRRGWRAPHMVWHRNFIRPFHFSEMHGFMNPRIIRCWSLYVSDQPHIWCDLHVQKDSLVADVQTTLLRIWA